MKLLFAAVYLIKNPMITTEEEKKEAQEFYKEALQLLKECGVDFMLGGAFSLFAHTGIYRDTKDLDIFCRPSDYSKILQFFADKGFTTQLTDIRWLAKVLKEIILLISFLIPLIISVRLMIAGLNTLRQALLQVRK
jgi:hypothetical protein